MTIKAVVFDAYGTLYDIQSVAAVTEEAFPGYGEIITQIWRIKQLEYTWLRSLMRRYEDFSVDHPGSLAYTSGARAESRCGDVRAHHGQISAPRSLSGCDGRAGGDEGSQARDPFQRLAPACSTRWCATAASTACWMPPSASTPRKIFKPAPDAYTLIETTLGVPPAEVLFVSSNPWDACGAKSFGLNVAWIERVTPEAMALACVKSDVVPPLTMFKAIRTQMDELGLEPDYRIHALSELPELVARP